MHRVIASIFTADVDRAVHAIRTLPAEATTAEVRLDALWPETPQAQAATDDLVALLDAADAAGKELLVTLRPTREGGRHAGDEAVRLNLLAAAARAGATIDLELDAAIPAVTQALRADGARYLLSRHHPGPPPCKEDGMRALLAMQDEHGSAEKLALQNGSFPDFLRSLELSRAHAKRHGHPILMPLGGGALPRAALGVIANEATYGYADGLAPAAAGQPALADILAAWRHWGITADDLAGSSPDDRAGAAADGLTGGPMVNAGAPSTLTTPERPWLAVVGHPVEHSLSPRLHNANLRALGRSERFIALDVPASASALRLGLMVFARNGMVGASVTAPHKQDAARIGQGDAIVLATGAANCIRVEGETLRTTNTDATALKRLLDQHLDANAPCVVLGSGGAARAAIWAAKALGAVVHFTSRDPERAKALSAATGATWTPWERRDRLNGQAWIQTTPSPEPLVTAGQLRGRPLCIELSYANGPTHFQQTAAAAGCAVVDGKTFLVEQAVDAHRFWFGQAADQAVMARAIEQRSEPQTPHGGRSDSTATDDALRAGTALQTASAASSSEARRR